MKNDSSERPYKCTVCNKGYNTLQDVKRHFTVHSDASPCQCRSCDRFKQMRYLKWHMNKCSGDHPKDHSRRTQ